MPCVVDRPVKIDITKLGTFSCGHSDQFFWLGGEHFQHQASLARTEANSQLIAIKRTCSKSSCPRIAGGVLGKIGDKVLIALLI